MKKPVVSPGDKFGRLTVIQEVEPDRHGFRMFKCQCDCGTVKVVRAVHSKSARAKSCGCLIRERSVEAAKKKNTLPLGEANFRALYADYKAKASKRNLDWNLSPEEFRELTSKPCRYCGTAPATEINKNRKLNGIYVCNGVDRRDSTKGYTKENVVPCCRQCNTMKWDYSESEFLSKIREILAHESQRQKTSSFS